MGTRGTGPGRSPRPIGVGIVRLWLVLLAAFAILAAGAGYWQVLRAQDLVDRADDPLLVAAARQTVRGRIFDRSGTVLATSRWGPDGEPYRVYASRALAPVLGYSSSIYGTSGLEQAYDAALSGVSSSDPIDALLAKFRRDRFRPEDLTLSLSLPLQHAAVR